MKTKIVKSVTVTLALVLTSTSSFAADFDNCKVTEVVTAGLKNAHVSLDCQINTRPACATAGSYFGFDKSTEEGKQYLSVVLTAFSMGATLTGYVDDNICSPNQSNVALVQQLRLRK